MHGRVGRLAPLTLDRPAENGREPRQEILIILVEMVLVLAVHLEDAPHPVIDGDRHVNERDDAVVAQQAGQLEFPAVRQVVDI